jgi:catecholate siderophore receptor
MKQFQPRRKPLAAALAAIHAMAAAPAARKLLPLGAMLTGMMLAPLPLRAADTDAEVPTAETTLPTVNVKDVREREAEGYKGEATSVGKLPQAPRDIPQSLTIVPEQLMHDRNAHTLKEALHNVAGLTFNAGEGGRIGDNITLRGYSAVGDLYLDGMRDVAQYNREVFNLEQIDVLRGSASMLFGRGSTGGIINQVSKQAFMRDTNRVGYTTGSHDYERLTADVNKVVGDHSAIRVNAMATDTDSFRDTVHQSRWGIAPTASFGIGSADQLTLSYYRLSEHNIPDYGVPYFQGKPLDVPVNRFYGLAGDYEVNDTDIATATYQHRFSPDTTLKTALRYASYARDLWASAPRLPAGTASISDSTTVNRGAQRRGSDERTLTSQTDLTTAFETFGLKHQLLTGVELVKEQADRWSYAGTPANPATNVGNPDPNAPLPAGYGNTTRINPNSYEARSVGVYAQDMLALAAHWKLLLGARWDRFQADYDRSTAGDLERTDRVWSYRSGLIWQPTETAAYYVSYGTSFNPSAELYQLDDRGANTPPEESRNIEAGAKWDLFDGDLALRTAIFRSEKTNERNTDLAVSVEQNLLTGKRHTDGIELEAAGRVTRNWEVFAAYAYMSAEIDAATGNQANTLGKTPLNTPNFTFSLWSTYKLGGGWKVGAGAEGAGDRWANNTNTNEVPRYTRCDALLAYAQRRYELRLNVLNLFDRDYYEGVYQGHAVPGTKRSAQLTGEVKF